MIFQVKNIDDVWHLKDVLKNSTGNLTETSANELRDQLVNNIPNITDSRAIRTEQRIEALGTF